MIRGSLLVRLSLWALFAHCLVATGCPGDPPDAPSNDAGCVDGWQEAFLGETEAAAGDLSCFDGSTAGRMVPEACQGMVDIEAQIVDHQNGNGLPMTSVEVFFGNDISQTPDIEATTNEEGQLFADAAQQVPACQAIAYRTEREADDEARITLAQHKVWTPMDPPLEFDFRSVANATIGVVTSPVLGFGVELEEGKAMVFGKVVGCDFEAVEHVQVILRDASCAGAEGSLVGYTRGQLPDTSARATTPDGFYFGLNFPPGAWTLEAYRATDDGFELLGASPAILEPDGVTLVDIFVGRLDGQVVPDECFCDEGG